MSITFLVGHVSGNYSFTTFLAKNWCGERESNPCPKLGKLISFRLTTTAFEIERGQHAPKERRKSRLSRIYHNASLKIDRGTGNRPPEPILPSDTQIRAAWRV